MKKKENVESNFVNTTLGTSIIAGGIYERNVKSEQDIQDNGKGWKEKRQRHREKKI